MRNKGIIVRLFIILITMSVMGGSLSARTQYQPDELTKAIENKDQELIVSILKNVSENPDYVDSLSLFVTSNVFLQFKNLETASFLFYAAQIRAAADLKVYKPQGKGGNSPAVALGAVKYQIGSVINPNIVKYPKIYAKVINKLENWSPIYEINYNPGWEYVGQPSIDDARDEIEDIKQERIEPMREISQLLNNKEYFDAFLIVQEQNFLPLKDRNQSEKQEAELIMENIEEKLGLNGFIGLNKKN